MELSRSVLYTSEQLVDDPFGNSEPVEFQERIRDVLRAVDLKNEQSCGILHQLQTTDQMGWQVD